ncbi:hypothetical protein GE278_20370 [Enterobacteriaceae bacterium Kacie_13]|nr:hypothetical protein GE278_20370 [Enterobacteriaceae bacterium Kacie_13]
MHNLKCLLLFICLCCSFSASAITANCTGTVPPKNFSLPYNTSLDSLTAPGNPSQYKLLYTWSGFDWGYSSLQVTCNPTLTVDFIYYVVPPAGSVPVKDSASGNWIFPIPGTGFGLSFYNLDQQNGPMGNYQNPWVAYRGSNGAGGRTYVRVALWKLPGAVNPSNVINFDGFQVISAYRPVNGADTWGSVPNNGPNLISNTLTALTTVVSGNITLTTGTCNFDDINVPMGSYDVTLHGGPSRAGPMPWKDASFTLKCPPAMGYGRTGSVNTNNNTVTSRTTSTAYNQNINITVVPRSEIFDNVRGIMKLNSGGAGGYGVQLAWGTVASQSTDLNPAQPVIFNTPIQRATAVLTIGSTTNMVVNMAARYIRTEGNIQPGPADASVEIIANYN